MKKSIPQPAYYNLREDKISLFLFITICVVWGFTWIMGKYQINSGILPELAVSYRLFPISLVMFIITKFMRKSIKITLKDFKILFIYAILCCFQNFILFYYAALYIITSISAIAFSFSIIIIAVLKKLLNISGEKLTPIFISALCGISGLIFVMLPQLKVSFTKDILVGISIAFSATFFYSAGAVYYENQKAHLNISHILSSAYVMLIGSFLSFSFTVIHSFIIKTPINFWPIIKPSFILSYIYLLVSGFSLIIIMILIKRIGAIKTAYTNLITPVIAILISSVLEDYKLGIYTVIGITLIISSNYMALYKKK